MNEPVTPEDVFKVAAPLNPLLSDDKVWEIMIDGHERVLVDRDGKIEEVESPFASAEALRTFIDGLFGLYGLKLDADNPVGYLRLPDHSRAMAVVPPNAVEGPYMVLRRIVGSTPSWEQLIKWGSVPPEARDLLRSAVEAQLNILISGGTGSGKTTVANLIAEMSPPQERLIIVEQAYEMHVRHPRVIRLEAGGPAGLSLEEMLAAATRMRPDRLVVGNINGPVAASVMQHFSSGIVGMAHTHGTSVENSLSRLESFCLMADLGLGLTEIRQLIAAAIQLITHQQQLPDGSRKIVEIVELRGIDDHRYILQPLMRYNRESGQFDFTGTEPGWES